LHGGANARVMSMFRDIRDNVKDVRDDEEIAAYLGKILDGTAGDSSKKIYGLGHAVYTISDPRAVIIKKYSEVIAEHKGYGDEFALMERIESLGIPMIMERKNFNTPICANVDLYSGLVYTMLGIPEELFTPLFAIARIAGWCAHRIEEISCNKIIRPAYRAAFTERAYTPRGER